MKLSLLVTVLALAVSSPLNAATQLNAQGSVAVAVENSAVENFYRISPDLYRSGQPSGSDMQELQSRGFKSILNLRQYNSDDKEARGTTLGLYHIRMNAGRVRDEQVIDALKVIRDAPKPMLVHCWHGSDRTGLVVAMYRIVFEGWSKEAAINELKQPQFGHHESIYKNIPRYIEQADVEAIRRAVLGTK